MTSRALIVLAFPSDRAKAKRLIDEAPNNARVTIQEPKRSLPQNDRFWAHMTDIAEQTLHHGQRLDKEDWRVLFLDALDREARMVPTLQGVGWVNLGRSSSRLSKAEMADLITYVEAWCAQNNITLRDSSTIREPAGVNSAPGRVAG